MARQLQTEKEYQKQAFLYYYSLGPKRSYDRVAAKFEVSKSTVKAWGRSFAWAERIAERDAQVSREVASRTLTNDVSKRERNLKIVEMALMRLAKSISEGHVKMTLADLDRLIRLEAFLRDMPDSRQELVFSNLKNKSTEELREMMRQEIETLKKIEAHEIEIEEWELEGKLLTARTEKGEQDDKDSK